MRTWIQMKLSSIYTNYRIVFSCGIFRYSFANSRHSIEFSPGKSWTFCKYIFLLSFLNFSFSLHISVRFSILISYFVLSVHTYITPNAETLFTLVHTHTHTEPRETSIQMCIQCMEKWIVLSYMVGMFNKFEWQKKWCWCCRRIVAAIRLNIGLAFFHNIFIFILVILSVVIKTTTTIALALAVHMERLCVCAALYFCSQPNGFEPTNFSLLYIAL